MATGYIKQSTYIDGNVITASLFNEDFGALQNAFAYTTDPTTTGHTHDGSAHQGGAISKIGDADFNNKIEIDGTDNAIKLFIEVGGTTATETLNLTASALSPSVASIDLGVSSQPFDAAYLNSITMPDSDGTTNRINLGAGTDFNIHYNANNTAVIQSTTAGSVIDVDGKAGVKLKTDGTERLAATSTGVDVSGAFTVSTDVLVVDDTNNRVGIGTTSPLYNLVVNDSASSVIQIRSGSDDASHLYFADTDDDNIGGVSYSHQYNFMNFKTNDTERMRIDSSGNVGIGTDSPDSALEVQGSANGVHQIHIQNIFDDDDANAPNPSSRLYLSAASNNAYIQCKSAPTDSDAQHEIDIGSTAVGSFLTFSPSAAEAMRIDSSGNVGIGTSSPEAKLHTVGANANATNLATSATNAKVRSQNHSGSSLSSHQGYTGDSWYTQIANGSGTTAYDLSLNPYGGNVGIGTSSPASKLHVQGTGTTAIQVTGGSSNVAGIYLGDAGGLANGRLSYSNADNSLQLFTSGSEAMRIDSSGNVGIGTTSPATALDVTGTVTSDNFKVAATGALESVGTIYIDVDKDNSSTTAALKITADGQAKNIGRFVENGDVSFYEDTGTTAKFFWDASAERLGIGTSSPSEALDVVGNIAVNGTVDGRDLSVDGAKLDLIEANADVTDSVNVEAAGALMDSEVTNLDQVKVFDSSDYATAAQGTKADSALQNLVEDTSPELGGDLDLSGNRIIGTGRISVLQSATAQPGIELTSTTATSDSIPGPSLRLSRNSSGTEDGDLLGQVEFRGFDSNDTQIQYASIRAAAADATSSAAYGQLDFYNIKNGTDTKVMSLSPTALDLDTGVTLNTGGLVNITGSTSKLTFDSSGTDVVTITGYQLGATTPNTDLTLRCDKTISLQNVNLSVSGLPHNDVLTVNATTDDTNALTFFSKPHYPERTGLPLTTTSSPTPPIGTSDAVFVYDTTKDFDGGQWRLSLENESFQSLNRTLPKTMILEADGNKLRIIDPSFREDPFVTTTISLDGIASSIISKIVAQNGYVLVYMSAPGSAGVVVLLDLIENKAIKYLQSGTLEYYACKNLAIIQRPDAVRYKVKSGYHTMTAIRNAFLSFPILDGKELNSKRPKVRVNLVGSTGSLVSYINKDEFSTSVTLDGIGLHGTNNKERNSVFVSSATGIIELVDDYDVSFTGTSSTSGSKSTRIKISETIGGDSTLLRQFGTDEAIEQMSENGLAYITSYGSDSDSLTQLIPLRSLDQYDINSTSPGLLFSKITETKVSGIVPNKSTGFTALSEKQGNTTSTAISTAVAGGVGYVKVYQDKDIIMPFLPNLPVFEATALVSTELTPVGDTSVPLKRFNVDPDGPSQLGAYGLPEEITDAEEDHNIIDIDHGTAFSVTSSKGFYLSFWIKFANSYTAAADEDIITIGQDDGKQIKIALDSNSLPALYRKDSGTTYSSATLDTPTGADAPDLTEWTNVTLLKPLGRTGFTQLFINGVEVDSSTNITASTFYDVSPSSSDSTIKIITSHKYVVSLVKHYVPLSTFSDSLTPAMVEKIYDLEKPMFGPSTGITYLKAPSNVSDKNFVTFNEHTKTLSVINTAATIEYDGLISKRVDTSLNRIQPTVAVSSGSNLLVGE